MYIFSILILKANNGYYFILDSCFPGQHTKKICFLFKMYVHRDGSGHDFVKWMQLGGDLQIVWIMFNYVKHVEGWTTLACHVYDYFYYKAMMIAICAMQFEYMKV